jgi:sigma-B regulation protein RsbU (phosphoserine phosphatase)
MLMAPGVHESTSFERWSRLLGLYLLAPMLLLLTLPVAVHISQKPDCGWTVHHLVVMDVDEGGPAVAAGVRKGDRIVAVDGLRLDTMVDYYVAQAGHYQLEPRRVLLDRPDGPVAVEVAPRRPPRPRMVWDYSLWIAGLAFLLIGWWVLSRRNDPVARNFFALCLIFAFFLMDVPDWPSRGYITAKEHLRFLMQLMWPVFFLRFFMLFPTQGPLTADRRRRHRMLLIPIFPFFALALYAQARNLDPASSRLMAVVQTAFFLYFAVYFVAGLAIFARKVLRRDRPIQHTKLRVVLFGLVGGLTPFLVGAFLGNFFPDTSLPNWEFLGFSLVLVPLSFGLAILRYGALDTSFVIRCSLTYGSLTILLLVLYFGIVGAMGTFLTEYFRVSTYPLAMVTVAGCALVMMPVRRRLQVWVDSTFYPSRLASRVAISELGHELTGLIDDQDAAQTLLARLADLYRPERLSLFLRRLRDPGVLREYASVCDRQQVRPIFSLRAGSALARFLDELRRPVFAEEFEEMHPLEEPESESRSFLQRLGCELLVPLVVNNQLAGFLAFGPKGSGALYSQEDLANLRNLAIQAAALLESRRLYHESLRQKQLETELSVAQEIQAQLLPTEPLVLPGVRICGQMESCREVGGDYFDHFALDSGMVALAVGDVSGKGIPAALLMTTLRTTFRSEAVRFRQPAEVMGAVNQAIAKVLAPGQFISFFYGVYAVPQRSLTFCNAGMNPPVVFRAGRDYVEYLRKGGPPLGIDPSRPYRSGTLLLEPGDLVLLYTDGLTEEVNDRGEFFDLDRLVETVRIHRRQPIEDLRATIFTTVNAFGGPERSDDRTVMLMQIK